MTQIVILLNLFAFNTTSMIIFDFNKEAIINEWNIVNDVVMGGRSNANMSINGDGHGVFSGKVSLENNGGFCSVRYGLDRVSVKPYTKAIIKLKGDGKNYQFRVKSDYRERYAYISTFETSGEWEAVEIQLSEMVPTFRGRRLSMPNYPKEYLSEIRILIGNKKAENFELIIDSIVLE